MTAGTAQAAKPPVGFVQSEEISASCSALAGEGVRVPIRNETSQRQKVRVALVLLRPDGRQVRKRAVCGGLRRGKRKLKLRPGGGAAITLRAGNGAAKGTFTGSIVIFGRKGRVARRELTIGEAPALAAAIAMKPIAPSVSAAIHAEDKGPIWVPVKGSNAELPAIPKNNDGKETIPVGALTGPGGVVTLAYAESKFLASGFSQVGIELEGGLSPGTYSGQIDLAPEDDEFGTVSFELKVSRSIGWAIIPLLLGILVGIMLLGFSGRTVPAARLRARVAALSTRYEKARNALRSSKGAGGWREIEIANLGGLQAGLLEQIKEAKKKFAVKIDSKSIDSVEAAIAVVEAQIDLLGVLPEHAQEVEKALQLPPAVELPDLEDGKDPGRPKLEQNVADLIQAQQLPAEKLKGRIDTMDAAASQVRELRGLEATLEKLWRARDQIEAGSERKHLEKELRECRRCLWAAEGADGLKEASDLIHGARKKFVEIETKPASPLAPALVEMVASFAQAQQLVTAEEADALTEAAQEASVSVPAAVPAVAPVTQVAPAPTPPPSPPPLDAKGARAAVNWALLLQGVVVFFAAAVALVAGLELLYTGKTWGTSWDFIAAFLFGVGAQTAVSALAGSLDEFTSLRWSGHR